MAKFTLDIGYDFDFVLLALVSTEPAYRIAYELNRHLNISLHCQEEIEMQQKKQQDTWQFSWYSFEDEEAFLTWDLYSNESLNRIKSAPLKTGAVPDLFSDTQPEITTLGGHLIPELKDFDYLLVLRGETDPVFLESLEAQIKEIPIILSVSYRDVMDLPSRKNLIF